MIRAVVFDLDGTLYDYDAAHAPAFRALTAYAGEHLSLAPERFEALYGEADRALRARCGGGSAVHNRLLRCQVLLERIEKPIAHAPRMAEAYWSTLLNAMRPMPGAREALSALKAAGLTVGVGTNMTARLQYVKLERLGLTPLVDFIVTSEEVGAEKPDARLFECCAMKAGCAAEACLYVGDNPLSDALAALRAGMRAAWLCRADAPGDAAPGAAVIRALSELPDLVDKIP